MWTTAQVQLPGTFTSSGGRNSKPNKQSASSVCVCACQYSLHDKGRCLALVVRQIRRFITQNCRGAQNTSFDLNRWFIGMYVCTYVCCLCIYIYTPFSFPMEHLLKAVLLCVLSVCPCDSHLNTCEKLVVNCASKSLPCTCSLSANMKGNTAGLGFKTNNFPCVRL